MGYSIGVDIGGTKIAAGLVNPQGYCLQRVELPSVTSDRESMFKQVVLSINKIISKSGINTQDIDGIGLGIPGKVDCERGIAEYQNNLPWNNFPIIKKIFTYFRIKNIVIDNDVRMAAFAEWNVRGSNKFETFTFLTISTGFSCCTIHKGEFIQGNGSAGEIGFFPIQFHPLNNQIEKLENVASGPGIVKLARKKLNESRLIKDYALTPQKVISDFKRDKPYAVATMNEALMYMAWGICVISCMVDPDRLVIGGGVINYHPELLGCLKKQVRCYLHPSQQNIIHRMEKSRLKGNAGIIGAGLKVYGF